MQVAIITHTTPESDVFRYVNVKQNFDDAVNGAAVLIMDKLMNGIYANKDDVELDIVNREEDHEATIEAYHITETIVD